METSAEIGNLFIVEMGTARTLDELRRLLDEAIERLGAGAEWYEWDDGSLMIYDDAVGDVARIIIAETGSFQPSCPTNRVQAAH